MLFFIIRGLVLANQGTIGQKGHILKRCKALLVPYVVFSVLNILYLAIDMAGKGSDRIVIEVERNLIHAVTLYGISVLWFLPALLLGEVWLVLIMKKIKLFLCCHNKFEIVPPFIVNIPGLFAEYSFAYESS